MVAFGNMGWLSEMKTKRGGRGDYLKRPLSSEPKKSTHLGILAFETAKAMTKLVSLYNSLSDEEISRLRNHVMRSQGVAYLNSMDESLLVSLACAERLEDLDRAATVVARLAHKCRDLGLNRFELIYTDLKLGIIDLGKLDLYRSKHVEKRVEKMKRLITATTRLYASLDALTELEVCERKLKLWRDKGATQLEMQKTNLDLFYQKLEQQRKEVRHFREISLWSRTFDKCVGLMAHLVCILYARICVVFGPYIPILPSVIRSSHLREIARVRPDQLSKVEPVKEQMSHSGPIPSTSKPNLVRFYSQKSILFVHEDEGSLRAGKATKNNRAFHAAGPSTVGGSGLALRYANVILLAEKYLDSAEVVNLDTREYLYEMLPENLKSLVKAKLSKNMKHTGRKDQLLAEGWREALRDMMAWLAPMAHNTIQWQLDKNPEKMKFDSKPSVLLLQTLHFSDKEKTEAAIAEVLVALSCIFRFESCRSYES